MNSSSSSNTSTIYVDSFEGAKPTLTYNAVVSRLRIQKAFTNDLANYYAERAKVQELYISSLNKLSNRLHSQGTNSIMNQVESLNLDKKEEETQLGIWKSIKLQLENEVNEQSRISEVSRNQLVETVEVPIRNSLNKPDWLKYQQLESSIGLTVRDYETTLDKIQKAQLKGGNKSSSKSNTTKLLTAQSHLSNLGSNLNSLLPNFLSSSAILDLSHASFLKEALIRAGTLNSDIGRDQMEMGERLLVSVLGIDEQSEAQGWALREGVKAGANSNLNERESVIRSSETSSQSPSVGEFGARNNNTSNNNNSNTSSTPIQEEQETLKSSSRQRTASIPRATPPPVTSLALPTLPPPLPSPSKSSGFKLSSFMKRDRAGSNASASRYGSLDVPSNSNSSNIANNEIDRQSIDSRLSRTSEQLPEEPVSTSFARTNSNNNPISTSSTNAKAERPQSMMFGSKKRDSMMPNIFRRQSKMSPQTEKNQLEGGLSVIENGSENNGRNRSYSDVNSMVESTSTRNALGASTNTMTSGVGSVDSEGFSVPPAGYDKQPIGNLNLMDDDDEEEDMAPPLPVPKVSSVAITPITITESSDERKAALERVKTTLLSSKPLPGPSISPLGLPGTGVSRRGTTRGRRDNSRMSTYGSGSTSPIIPDDVPLGKIIEQQQQQQQQQQRAREEARNGISPLASPVSVPIGLPYNNGGERINERANSMMSTISSTSSARTKNGALDPFEHSTTTGMRASIVETVNVIAKLGVISRVMVTGELSLSHRLAPGEIGGQVRIKLSNFDMFEKAAPESTYLSAITDSPGEYLVKETLGEKTTTVIKYQLRVEEGNEKDFVPLLVKASWKIESGLARIMVVYQSNNEVKLIGLEDSPFEETITKLDDLSFTLPFSSPINTFQAKPLAIHSPENSNLSFNIDQGLVIETTGNEGTENKLLASVVTEGTNLVLAQPVAVKWSISGKILSGVTLELVEGKLVELEAKIISGKFLAL